MHRSHYDRFWADYLGVSTAELNTSGTSVAEHVGLRGYSGVWCFRRNHRLVISAPTEVVPHIRRHVESFDAANFSAAAFYEDLFGERFERLIGPAFQGWLPAMNAQPKTGARIEMLASESNPIVDRFRAMCAEDDWATSGLVEARQHFAAVFDGDQVVALAGYRPWTDEAGDVCMLTREDQRKKGFAAAAAWAVVSRASREGKLPLYQTLESNMGAIEVSRRLGYEPYARHVAIRLLRRDRTPIGRSETSG